MDPHYLPTECESESDSDEPVAQRVRLEMPPPQMPSTSRAVVCLPTQSEHTDTKLTPIQQRNKDGKFFNHFLIIFCPSFFFQCVHLLSSFSASTSEKGRNSTKEGKDIGMEGTTAKVEATSPRTVHRVQVCIKHFSEKIRT